VEAHRLRKRLREFYAADGAQHAVRIELQPGHYTPQFLLREESSNGHGASTDAPVSVDLPSSDPPGPDPAATLDTPPPAESPTAVIQEPERAPARPGGWTRWVVFAALALVVALAGLGVWLKRPIAKAGTRSSAAQPHVAVGTSDIRILAGDLNGTYVDRLGNLWQSDRFFNGGSVFNSASHAILGTHEPKLYQARREGSFSYDIPLAPGAYELRLYFAETLYGETNAAGGGETSRLFNIYINGNKTLDQFDVIEDAGTNHADVRAFKDIAPASDGKLHLKFEAFTNPAFLNAIEITPGVPGSCKPIRVVARDRAYTDKEGRVWEPDRYASGGQIVSRPDPVAGADDPELFRGERFGNIAYAIPVPPGKYAVTLYFAEFWFGPGKAAGGGIGSRVFDILCNGTALRRNFDIFKEGHGSNNAVRLTTHGLSPNAQGKLVITLAPVRNYACVDALEIVDESR
jgi:hypothetical protein